MRPMKSRQNIFHERLDSFRFAFRGLRDILGTEHNAWVHAFSTIIVIALCLWLRLQAVRLILVIIVIVLVWVAEAFNTVLEIVIDIVSPEYTETARRAKDIAAAGVLFSAIGAFMAGIILLGPPLLMQLGIIQ